MQLFINNWATMLTAPAAASAASFAVPLADAAKLVGLGEGGHYVLTLAEVDGNGLETAWETVKITASAAGVLTALRGQEGTTARDWAAASIISARVTKGTLEALQSSSGTAVGDAVPQPLGEASPGEAATASRDDHVHPKPTAADLGAATAAQGAKADTAVQPAALADALAGLAGGASDLWPYRVSVEEQDQSNSNPALPTCRFGKLGLANLDGAALSGVNVYRFIPHRNLRIGRMTFNLSVTSGSASDKANAVIYDATADGWPRALIARTEAEVLVFTRYGGVILGGPIDLIAGEIYWVGTHAQVGEGLTVSAVTCQSTEEFVAWYLHGPWSTSALFGEFESPPGETPGLWSAALSESGVSTGDIPAVGVCESLT